jgi:hypothetical protein
MPAAAARLRIMRQAFDLAGRHPLRVIREIANVALRSLCCAN